MPKKITLIFLPCIHNCDAENWTVFGLEKASPNMWAIYFTKNLTLDGSVFVKYPGIMPLVHSYRKTFTVAEINLQQRI